MAHNYILQVTAGSVYDITKHQIVPVNKSTPIKIESEHLTAEINVRVQSYRGLPRSSPTTSPYFDLPPHSTNKDQYSIAFKFTPKRSINGNDLVFGNDFDHPIRDRLPPGFSTAFKIVKWAVDPGLDGDVYADKPYLYGPAASSVNTLYVGGKGKEAQESVGREDDDEDVGLWFDEGGDEDGQEIRDDNDVPDGEAARKKWFLNEEHRKDWEWEQGRTYGVDFYNPYLDFNDFALRLPGFTLPIMKYWDGQGLRPDTKRSHTLRYVLKDRSTDEELLVILFTLYLKEDVNEDGSLKDGVEGGKPIHLMDESEKKILEKNTNGSGAEKEKEKEKLPETNDDDVD